MSDDREPKPRFHFDPAYDASGAPTFATFVEWVRSRLNGEGEEGLPGAFKRTLLLQAPMSLTGRIAGMIPAVRHRRHRMAEESCIECATGTIKAFHDIMREFGIDLTSSRHIGIVEGVLSLVILDAVIEKARRLIGDEGVVSPTSTSTETIQISRREDLRDHLASEALDNLLANEDLRSAWQRMVAALRAAKDKFSNSDLRDAMVATADRIEGALGGRMPPAATGRTDH